MSEKTSVIEYKWEENNERLELIRWTNFYQTLGKNIPIKTKDKILIEELFEVDNTIDTEQVLKFYSFIKDFQKELHHIFEHGHDSHQTLSIVKNHLHFYEQNLERILSGRYTYNIQHRHIKSYIWDQTNLL